MKGIFTSGLHMFIMIYINATSPIYLFAGIWVTDYCFHCLGGSDSWALRDHTHTHILDKLPQIEVSRIMNTFQTATMTVLGLVSHVQFVITPGLKSSQHQYYCHSL